ncbi:hypothetical protein [Spirillospora sp. CA-128828]|uniref:hypothetical protein n=1 Tax=Spirillospora sp. CA-128828 TaxID=3240033 RepID=UPI003D8CB66D
MLVATTIAVAIGVLVLSFAMKWEQADKLLAAVSALAGVVSISVAVWLAPDRTAHPTAGRGADAATAGTLRDIDIIGQWQKVTETGRHFTLVLKADGDITEWDPSSDEPPWSGKWTVGPGGELQLFLAGRITTLRPSGAGFHGQERIKRRRLGFVAGKAWVTLRRS